jgi:uncharacterized damage-inducible protein DinB
MSIVKLALEQIVFVRNYTTHLLDNVPPEDWFRQPSAGVSTIAWQVGHLAMAEYRLALERIRGRRPEDEGLIPEEFLKHFARASIPNPDPAQNPSVEHIRAVFESVHRQALAELETLSEDELSQPVLKSHPLAKTKQEALFWCSQHEMLHAGQIGLLRRQLGYAPLW